ncbi:MAG: acyltransferase [Oscillospiraceae bacterium]|nr:acyltransferase [Oscillospiraceae bacterium]
MTQELNKPIENKRNYQLDFLKLIFSILVFFFHTELFAGENVPKLLRCQLGEVSVHFFFVVTGMLMVNSIMKHDPPHTGAPGKSAITFVLRKFKGISWQYWTSLFIFMVVYLFIYNDFTVELTFVNLFRAIPEALLVHYAGLTLMFNMPLWYLSAMFLSMLFLVYLIYRHRDFALYVFSPLTAVFTLGYMGQVNNYLFVPFYSLYGVVVGGVIRALCGLCFGVVAWLIYNRISQWRLNRNGRIVLTIVELLLYTIFFTGWLILQDNMVIMSVILILPIALAISFSGKSYISKLFGFKWMKHFGVFSLAVYLNQWTARYLVHKFFPDCSYKNGVLLMALFTIAAIVLYFAIIYFGKALWKKLHKKLVDEQEVVEQ